MFKNQVAQHGSYVVTEEVNCYIVWFEPQVSCVYAFYFNNESGLHRDKDCAFITAKGLAERRHKLEINLTKLTHEA
jgi:hypothetical protein